MQGPGGDSRFADRHNSPVLWVVLFVYGLLCLVAILNLLLMRKPGRREGEPTIVVLIPARNEAENLRRLLPTLTPQAKVYVFDDESEDGTGEVAASLGATVVRPREALPKVWTGKNRACHELAKAVCEDSDAGWYLFLDADVRPGPEFVNAMRDLCGSVSPRTAVVTGIPQVLPGRGIEPLFLAWVGWVILATNPFGLVSRSGMGHNRFTNGQVHCWRASVYTEMWPNEQVRHRIMEDVMMGRLLAKHGHAVLVANLSNVLGVKMYDHWRETLDGMSKNSFEVTNSVWGSVLLSLWFLFMGWSWLLLGHLWWVGLLLMTVSGFAVTGVARTARWPALMMPIVATIGAYTVLRSTWWRMTGRTVWKGRVYC